MSETPKILVVDDTESSRRLIKGIFSRRNYEVITVSSGVEALSILEQDGGVDVALLDIKMPDMDGFEVLEKIKANPRTESVKVIMLSAVTQEQDKLRTFSAGAADYVVKPFKAGELLARVETQVQLKRTEEALRAQKQLFENLVAVAHATTEKPTLEATLQNVLDVALTLTGAERGSLFLLDQAVIVTHTILARGDVTPALQQDLVGTVMDRGLAGWVVQHRQHALIHDTVHDERWLPLPDAPYTARSVLAVPIVSRPAILGVLTLIHSEPRHFNADHAQLMQAAGDQMALALRNAQIYEAQRRLADRQITLYEVLTTVGKYLDPETIARTAVEVVEQLIGWPAVALLLAEDAQTHLVVQAAAGVLSGAEGQIIPIDQGIVGRAFRTAQTQHAPDVSADPDYAVGHPDIRSELAVPLRRGERVLGVLDVESKQSVAFDPDDVVLAESLAEAIALALDNARLFQTTVDERQRLLTLIESSQDGIIFIGMDRRVRVVNTATLEFLHLAGSPEDWTGRPIREVLAELETRAPDVVHMAVDEIRRIKVGDEPPGEGEYEVPPRTLHWLNLPVVVGTSPLGRLLVLHDVTEERLLERMRDDLTRTMVHDLRNPLTALSVSLQLLETTTGDTLPSSQRQMLSSARNSTRRMLDLVNAILDISHLESGRMPLEQACVSLAKLVAAVLDLHAPLTADEGLHLESDVPSDLPPVRVDARLIERVLQNLVGNACKFTPTGGLVRVTARANASAPSQILVSVSDTGPGIQPEIREHLFQKFVTGKQEGRGSGLGLAFCKMVLEAHGQRIWVESEPGQGATFFFTLPVASKNGSLQS